MNKISYLIFMTLFFISSIFAQETTIIQDDLQGNTSGTQVGGSFTSEGYKPGVGFNHILYDVPSQVVNGYVEFQIKGFDPSALPADADNGFAGLYDGRGISEPIQYFNNFKYNFFRWNFHWRENRDAFKAVISVAAPTSSRLFATKAVYTLDNSPDDGSGNPVVDWHTEPTGNGWTFNSTTWYTIKIEWKNRNFKIYANNTVVWSTSGPYDYAPIDFKVWLGCAPGSNNKYKNQSASIVYRNFKIVSDDLLPVELSTFTASVNVNDVNLNWKTATEVNNNGFEVQRATRGQKSEVSGWEKIGFVQGHGNSNSPKDYTFTDKNLTGGTKFIYRLKQIDNNGQYQYSKEVEVEVVPEEYMLYQNYPNPFNPVTEIKYNLPEASKVVLNVHNIIGQQVRSLVNGIVEAGYHSVTFDGRDLPSGTYIYRLQTNNSVQTKKMILLK